MTKHIQTNTFRLISMLFLLISFLTVLFLHGCAAVSSSVIASTGTTIGVKLSQNPTSQTPTAVLGYKRAELAYVPTNRGTADKTTTKQDSKGHPVVAQEGGLPTTAGGARDSANVLMELRYSGIFHWGSGSGIYQRLAVGDRAVSQPGAAFMFSKDFKGEIDENISKYLAAAQQEIAIENYRIERIVSYVADGSGAINTQTLITLVSAAENKAPNIITNSVKNEINFIKTASELKEILSDDLDTIIEPLYKSIPIDKQ